MNNEEFYDISKLIGIVVRYRRTIILSIFIWGVIGICVSLSLGEKWESHVKILPNTNNEVSSSGLVGLASLAGVNMAGGTGIESYYSSIVKSPVFLQMLMNKKWLTSSNDSLFLDSIFNISKRSFKNKVASPEYFHKQIVLNTVASAINYTKNSEGVIVISALTPDPLVSKNIIEDVVKQLSEFVNRDKKIEASKKRKFVESQLLKFDKRLQQAEENLLAFRKKNIARLTPELKLSENRLSREVSATSGLVSEFRRQVELARIEELKGINELKIIEYPSVSLYRSSPKRKLIVLISIFVGGFFGIAFVLLQVWWTSNSKKVKIELSKK